MKVDKTFSKLESLSLALALKSAISNVSYSYDGDMFERELRKCRRTFLATIRYTRA